ncbi:MAG: hypothetical protein IPP91_10320 [Betaproteobacteria bacterium]|nr:hypothetical protein [Betaproteobacteria bacterium]
MDDLKVSKDVDALRLVVVYALNSGVVVVASMVAMAVPLLKLRARARFLFGRSPGSECLQRVQSAAWSVPGVRGVCNLRV